MKSVALAAAGFFLSKLYSPLLDTMLLGSPAQHSTSPLCKFMHTGLFQGSCIVKLQKPPFRKRTWLDWRLLEKGQRKKKKRRKWKVTLSSLCSVNVAKKPKEVENCHTLLEWFLAGKEVGPQVIGKREKLGFAGWTFSKKRLLGIVPPSSLSFQWPLFSSLRPLFSAIYRLPLAQGETHLALISMAV